MPETSRGGRRHVEVVPTLRTIFDLFPDLPADATVKIVFAAGVVVRADGTMTAWRWPDDWPEP